MAAAAGGRTLSESPDPFSRGEPKEARRTGVERATAGIVMWCAVCLLVGATVFGLVSLWPHGRVADSTSLGIVHTDGAVVAAVRPVACGEPGARDCKRVRVTLTSGPRKGSSTSFSIVGQASILALSSGDHIRVYANRLPAAAAAGTPRPHVDPYSFFDFDRRGPMLWLGIAFVVLLLVVGRWRGARALLGLGVSLVVIVSFVIPAILHGGDPVLVALVGAFAVMLVTMPLTYGLGAKMVAPLLGTSVSLLGVAAISNWVAEAAHLSGASSDETLYLAATQSHVSLHGLVIAGMVIGALGVLLDLTVSQASTVLALRRADPELGIRGLFREAMDVGHDHVAATVNTLVFAYAGASLPILLIFAIGHVSFSDAINGEAVAEQTIAALVGSIGLILSLPLTTLLAALLADGMPRDALVAEPGHAHGH